MIYWYHIIVCVLDQHFMLEWPWPGRNWVNSILQYLGLLHLTKFTPYVHLDVIYWCHMVVCVFDLHLPLQWSRVKTQNANSGAPVMVPITIMSSICYRLRCPVFPEKLSMPPAWKVCRGHLVIRSCVCLSFCLSVIPSRFHKKCNN